MRNRLNVYLKRIEDHQGLNAFIQLFPETALAQAREVDEKVRKGQAGRLAGTILGIKDVICYQGHGLTASSKILDALNHSSLLLPYSACSMKTQSLLGARAAMNLPWALPQKALSMGQSATHTIATKRRVALPEVRPSLLQPACAMRASARIRAALCDNPQAFAV